MKPAQQQIARMRADVDRIVREEKRETVRPAPDVKSLVFLRDDRYVPPIKLPLMCLGVGTSYRRGDFVIDPATSYLEPIRLPWWKRSGRVRTTNRVFRVVD